MIPLPTVLTLRNTRVHISSSDYSDMAFYIETPINKALCFHTILRIPNVNPYHC